MTMASLPVAWALASCPRLQKVHLSSQIFMEERDTPMLAMHPSCIYRQNFAADTSSRFLLTCIAALDHTPQLSGQS